MEIGSHLTWVQVTLSDGRKIVGYQNDKELMTTANQDGQILAQRLNTSFLSGYEIVDDESKIQEAREKIEARIKKIPD